MSLRQRMPRLSSHAATAELLEPALPTNAESEKYAIRHMAMGIKY